ncbi:hypothetical protein DFR29_10441 [Tahibacter aquaticus]|uniref:MFS transporter n=1 Tax=Tahibacter aquaticus TaxID=520092 RepID=A0A4R6Z217_9GAMM|nr:MFS transporter [Tahibacter aquaticus]TDR45613.1 hypothetical protein DFR29_10441 [Tahibacter aquaticus]
MSEPRPSAIAVLGAAQCVYWGILYYAFSVLMVPLREALGTSDAAIAGAFSLGLTVSALLATTVGRRLDKGQGIALLRGGAFTAAGLLLVWSQVESLAALYAVWVGLGVCMALVLYETAFGLVTRAHANAGVRMRALAVVTVLGGLASTLFLPLTGAGVTYLGWRTTLQALAVVWLLMTLCLEGFALPHLRTVDRREVTPLSPSPSPPDRALLRWAGTPFVVATFAGMALTTLVVPHMVKHGHSLEHAAWVLAALGVMQLPGRLWLWRGGHLALSPRVLLVMPLVLQVLGLALLGIADTLTSAFLGVAIFGVGAGLHTLARPWIAPFIFGVESAGRANGAIAQAQGFARACGPFVVASSSGFVGSNAVFLILSLVLLACCPLAYRLSRHHHLTASSSA